MTDVSSDPSAETSRSAEPIGSPRNRSWPRPWVWVVWVACCLGVLAVRRLEIDLAVINIVSAILLGIAGGLFVIWWTFRSGLPSWIRLLLPVALCVGASVFYSRYEIVGTSGSLVPQFVRRGSLLPDEQLEVGAIAPAADQTIDLSTTSEFDFQRFLAPASTAGSRMCNWTPIGKQIPRSNSGRGRLELAGQHLQPSTDMR